MSDLILYNQYKDARDLVWKILTQYKIVDFPFNISRLARKMNIEVNEVSYLPKGVYAVSYQDNGNDYIDYVPTDNIAADRFTLAHELGHLLLRHKSNCHSKYEEEQANMFAARLLAPMIIVREYDPRSAAELSDIFGISLESANIRFNRYLEIKKRNKFLTNSLEKEYYRIYTSSKAN